VTVKGSEAGYSWKRDPLFWAYTVLLFLPIVFAFLFYNHHGLDICVYLGWILMAAGVVIVFLAGGQFRERGGAPEGESTVNTTVLVDTGIYSIVRHPQYLGFMLIVLALVLLSQHWLSVVSAVTGSVLFYRDTLREERMSVKKFGEGYERYMQRVPRINPVRGILRLLRR
jgi:protein-S-isoprenylcysteine O-methyltransferase Ste14